MRRLRLWPSRERDTETRTQGEVVRYAQVREEKIAINRELEKNREREREKT